MFPPVEIEKRLMAEFSAALDAELVTVTGSWQPVEKGLVKYVETTPTAACVSIAVGTPSRNSAAAADAEITANITLFVAVGMDPTGETFAALAGRVQQILDSFMGDTYQADFTRLDVEGFSVDCVTVQGGSSPQIQNDFISVSWPVTLSGSYII
jgi:hypothetical protein